MKTPSSNQIPAQPAPANVTLTARQQELLTLIKAWLVERGMPPTRAEICAALGFRSPNAAEEHLRALQRKGAIEMMPGASRGIRVVETMEESERFRDDSIDEEDTTAESGNPNGNSAKPYTIDARSTRIVTAQGAVNAKAGAGTEVGTGTASSVMNLGKSKNSRTGSTTSNSAGNAANNITHLPAHAANEEYSLPLIGKVAAGQPIMAQENYSGRYPVSPLLFSPRADYLLQVSGLSMKDIGIMDGDWLAIHKTEQARNGQIIVARVDGDVTVKRLKLKGNKAFLIAENADFLPIVVDLELTPLAIEGLVVGVIRSFH